MKVKESYNMWFREWLRAETHYKNTDEFFTAVLFQTGAPPHPVTSAYVSSAQRLTPVSFGKMSEWRDRVAAVMYEQAHHSIDPSRLMTRYLKWLLVKQENGSLSGL